MAVVARTADLTFITETAESFARMEALEAQAVRDGRDHLTDVEQSEWNRLRRGIILKVIRFGKLVVSLLSRIIILRPEQTAPMPRASDQRAPATPAWVRSAALARAP